MSFKTVGFKQPNTVNYESAAASPLTPNCKSVKIPLHSLGQKEKKESNPLLIDDKVVRISSLKKEWLIEGKSEHFEAPLKSCIKRSPLSRFPLRSTLISKLLPALNVPEISSRHASLQKMDKIRHNYLTSDAPIKRFTIQIDKEATLDGVWAYNHIELAKPISEQKFILTLNGAATLYEYIIGRLLKVSEDTGAHVLGFNYRGVGRSEGFPYQSKDLSRDAEGVLQFLLSKGARLENILIHGHSMGGGAGTLLASHYRGINLCNDRSFSTLDTAVNSIVSRYSLSCLGSLSSYITSSSIDWNFNSVENFAKVSGRKWVLYVPEKCASEMIYATDLMIAHSASLHKGLLDQDIPFNFIPLTYFPEKDSFGAVDIHGHYITFLGPDYEIFVNSVKQALRLG